MSKLRRSIKYPVNYAVNDQIESLCATIWHIVTITLLKIKILGL